MRLNCHDAPWWRLLMMLGMFAPVVISGCVEIPAAHPASARQYLIGQSESAVLACAGPPRTASSHDRVRVLSYYREGGVIEGSFPGSKSSRPEGTRHGCTATVTLQDDHVIQVKYRTTPDSSDLHEHCENIFQHCVPQ